MKAESYYYSCSPSYIDPTAPDLHSQIIDTIEVPPNGDMEQMEVEVKWRI